MSLYRSLKWWNMIPIGVQWFLTRKGPCASAHLEAGGFIRSREGFTHPNIQYHFLPSAFKDHGRVTVEMEAFQVRSFFVSHKSLLMKILFLVICVITCLMMLSLDVDGDILTAYKLLAFFWG